MHPNDGRVVSNFIVQALRGENITIFGNGSQTRSFCYVDDLIEGILCFMDLPSGPEGQPGPPGPINLGNPDEFSMLELASMIIEQKGSKSQIIHLPLPQDDPLQRKPDISLAKQYLNWNPEIHAREGLSKTIAYFASLQ
jgi:UDP-glucuronate decarboxylase